MPLLRIAHQSGAVVYRSPVLTSAGLPHAFSTRLGGVSAAPFDSLNLGNPNGCAIQDTQACLSENYRRLLAAAGCLGRELCRVHQVHGRVIAAAIGGQAFDPHQMADAIVSDDPSRAVSVRIADCVPVLLAAADGSVVAAVHAGWRGVVAGVVPTAIAAMRNMVPDRDLLAAVGPCISGDFFEVGPEVAEQFLSHFGESTITRRLGAGKAMVDMRLAILIQLHAAGISADRIDTCDCCTYRDAAEFFSHRRDNGITGRMAAVIGAR